MLTMIRKANLQMLPDKTQGPDGLNAAFFQEFWPYCGNVVVSGWLNWLNNGVIPQIGNNTNIVPIPKCDQPESMSDLHPISLCNVIYKILSKTLAVIIKWIINKVS